MVENLLAGASIERGVTTLSSVMHMQVEGATIAVASECDGQVLLVQNNCECW